jgi:hypothetical protein
MPYFSAYPRLTGLLLRAHSCPFLFPVERCAGGDYCPFPPGRDRICCFFCQRLDDCPDKTGVCGRLTQ